MKDRLCRVIKQRKQLITIFKFDSEKHRGNFEDAILEALFNGEGKFYRMNSNYLLF